MFTGIEQVDHKRHAVHFYVKEKQSTTGHIVVAMRSK